MKFTFSIFQSPETPGVWTAHCAELDIFAQSTEAEATIEAIANPRGCP